MHAALGVDAGTGGPAPRNDAEWTGEDVAKVGLPTMGPPPKAVEENDWATVTPPSPTASSSRRATGGAAVALPLRSPTLHAWPSAPASSACRCLYW